MTGSTTPAPQANRIETVVAVLDAVAAGCDTAASIGAGIGMHARQGGYYAHAGQTLGYLGVDTTLTPHEWSLTPAGLDLVAASAHGRARALTAALLALPEVEVFADDDTAVEELIADDGYAETTAARRSATFAAWTEFATQPLADQVASLETVMATAAQYSPAAAQARAVEKKAATKPAVSYGAVCSSCFTTKSLAGTCDSCD